MLAPDRKAKGFDKDPVIMTGDAGAGWTTTGACFISRCTSLGVLQPASRTAPNASATDVPMENFMIGPYRRLLFQ
jgi:hypothetical protein